MIDFNQARQQHLQAIDSVFAQTDLINSLIEQVVRSLQTGGKVLWCGNGGSAADAQHMAAELMVRYVKNRRPLASIALTTDSSILTAHTNDFEFESVFARQVEALAKPGDVLMSLSTSGSSRNVVLAQQQAKKMGVFCAALTGAQPSVLAAEADLTFQVNSNETARVQEAHSLISHLLCEGLDQVFS
ncbi:MAG: SIS domain-containing protein [Thiomicrospira sp.]|uniref:D-sedoheptulose-7-phosphate isomerase n=1 Tax=Thiomicrospira sp. TaxID=935 RepID=UPI0019E64866|nr:SIS domain-containing protein [Thiomicrospira sp.]MBE0493790.1 SIS domain-containing protein [Thiomicrospira sp.]